MPEPVSMPEAAALKSPDKSRRAAILATVGIVVILGAALCVVGFWPKIQLMYYRYEFRHGATKDRIKALEWICERRLEGNMPDILTVWVDEENRFSLNNRFLDEKELRIHILEEAENAGFMDTPDRRTKLGVVIRAHPEALFSSVQRAKLACVKASVWMVSMIDIEAGRDLPPAPDAPSETP